MQAEGGTVQLKEEARPRTRAPGRKDLLRVEGVSVRFGGIVALDAEVRAALSFELGLGGAA